MRLVLTGRNVEISPSLRQLVDRRLAKLERMLNDSMVSAQVVLTLEKYRHVAEVTVHARGDHILHGMGNATTWPASFTQALEKISQQAHKLKDRWTRRKRRGGGARALGAAEPLAAPPAAVGPAPRIIRTKRYPVKPMSIEDAAARLEEGDEAFLLFRNAATESINILYRRKDGRLGLIDPEA